MKKLITLFALLICLTNLKAQFVTIPDANFVAWLQANVPSAMSGNQMDTTSLAVTTRTIIELQPTQAQPSPAPILNYSGLQYFDGLKNLNINTNYSAQSLPKLPNSIENLTLVGFPSMNNIASLPNNLKKLVINLSNISTLPPLPTGLESLIIYRSTSFTWPQLPSGLKSLSCSNNMVNAPQYLPMLPNGLKELNCSIFQIDSLPQHLPDSLISLNCSMNGLTSIPTLPSNLKSLYCSNTLISILPTLPNSLELLNCSSSQSLTALPNLSNGLKNLSCYNANLSTIPNLPDSLTTIDCRNNYLTSLPQLPNKLKELRASNNQISCIPSLPTLLNYIDIANNSFTCLPNYLPIMDASFFSYPLCFPGNTITNPNGCERANGIIGNAYFDTNTNCIKDTNDIKLNNINFKLFNNNNLYLNQGNSYSNGIFNFTYPTGSYTIVLDTTNAPYTAQCVYPGVDTTIQLTTVNPVADNVNFSVKCKPGFDVGVQSVLTNGIVFPGQNHTLKIAAGDMSKWYNLNCASGISGQLVLNVSGPITYIAPAAGSLMPIVSGTTFTYNIGDFGTIDILNDFNLILKTDTIATTGDSICVSVNVTPFNGDSDVSNNSYNFCYLVANSFDPNTKEVYPVNVPPGFDNWLTYTIHFQNTGNAPAMNIRLLDTLDNNLDIESFKIINYSHSNTWSINNNKLFFHFQNIQLPDSTTNPDGSKGYVQYKIKPKNNLGAGTRIKNTAYIYFDYNSPIITNTTINEFLQVVSVKENIKQLLATIYPNPTNGTFTVELNTKEKQALQVFDITGNVVLSQTIENGKATIDANHLAAGIYNISIKGNASVTNKKLVIVR